jgi:hypothetical protein
VEGEWGERWRERERRERGLTGAEEGNKLLERLVHILRV